MNTKFCSNCKKAKRHSEFSPDKTSTDKLRCWCKTCCKLYSKKYYTDNKDKCIKKSTQWRKKNPLRAKRAVTLWKKSHREHVNKQERLRNNLLRKRAMEMVGPLCCKNCDCNKYEFLEINHILGNGYAERKNKQTTKFYREIISGKREVKDLNILCRPCNSIHYLEMLYGKLPYKIKWKKVSDQPQKK